MFASRNVWYVYTRFHRARGVLSVRRISGQRTAIEGHRGSYLEVLDAQEKLYPAQKAQTTARLGRLLNYVQLYKALGGGWNLSARDAAL